MRRALIAATLLGVCAFSSGCGLSGLLFWRDSEPEVTGEPVGSPPAPGACLDKRYYPEGTRRCREHTVAECRDGRWVPVATC